MSGRGKLITIGFVAVVLLAAFGLLRLFTLRFEEGDMFPPYSSLRSDPLGCKALYMSLERTAGLDAQRNFRDLEKLKGVQRRTIYYLGTNEALLDASSDGQAKELEALAREGNRLVITFGTAKGRQAVRTEQEDQSDDDHDEEGRNKSDRDQTEADESGHSCADRDGVWGLKVYMFDPLTGSGKARPQAALSAPALELPPTIPLNSRRHFEGEGKEWRPVYNYEGQAVVLEKMAGKGSIVLLADSYLVSNEALRSDRTPGLLAWLQGDGRTALFDESHLGVYDNPGIMVLIRKHRLVPFLLALMALAVLYVWKSAVPFVSAAVVEQEQMAGGVRDNFGGLVNLLRRYISPEALITVCFQEWERSFSRELRKNAALRERVQTAISDPARSAGRSDPLERYREIARILEKHKHEKIDH